MQKVFLVGSSALAFLFLAGCTSDQVTQTVNSACTVLGDGAVLAATIFAPALAAPATQITGPCSSLAPVITAAINEITGSGGTASVSVAAAPATAAALSRRLGAPLPSIHFTVTPDGQLHIASNQLARLRAIRH